LLGSDTDAGAALYGAKHLEYLHEQKLFKPSPSTALDEMYTAGLKYPTRQASRESPPPSKEEREKIAEEIENKTKSGKEDVMLLHRWNGKLLAEGFKLPDMEVEIERAVEQVEKAIKSEAELKGKKRIEEATAKSQETKEPSEKK
jgi:hypothetical protein